MPTLFSTHNPQIYVQDNKIQPVVLDGMKVMSLGFLLGESPAVLRGPIVSGYTQQTLKQTDWGKLDYLIIDLPPGTGDIQLTIVQQAALDGAIIVTTPQALSLVDVAKGILMFEKVNVPVLGIVENMCSFTCDHCNSVHYPFGRSRGTLQQRFGLSTLAELPISSRVAEIGSPARLAGLDALAENVHRAVGTSRVAKQDVPEVEMEQGTIRVRWPDGYEATLSNHDLRCACPCAMCVDEMSGERTLEPTSVPRDIAVEDAQPLGNYAVAFTWSDGHATGIYAWDYLRSLAEDAAAVK